MAQPEYVPVVARDRVRVSERLPTPDHWLPARPAEVRDLGGQPTGPLFGTAGPDQGYALKLAHRLEPKIVADHVDDAIAGSVGVAMRRAALFGRAPVIHDVDLAFAVFGFYQGAPEDLIAFRRPLFEGAARDYLTRRAIVDRVPEATLRLTPDAVKAQLASWRTLIVA
jgi:hypothetical protein